MNHLSTAFELDLGRSPEGLPRELSLPTNEDIQLCFLVRFRQILHCLASNWCYFNRYTLERNAIVVQDYITSLCNALNNKNTMMLEVHFYWHFSIVESNLNSAP